jgi:putative (di)nucleoside polyphosphate hydrolase
MLEWLKILGQLLYDRSMRKRLIGYRPVVMSLVSSVQRPSWFLLIQPAQDPNVWMPPQEGLEPNESIEAAVKRCLATELGLQESAIQFRRSLWIEDRPLPTRRGERDINYSVRPMAGKSYFAAYVAVDEQAPISANRAEVHGFAWVDAATVAERIQTNQADKQKIIRSAFQRLASISLSP